MDARSDIFSLGSVIYEMVTGRAAFEGETASDVIAEISERGASADRRIRSGRATRT